MNCVLYKFLKHKPINGTLFYGFEYFLFIKQFVPDVKYVLFDINKEGMDFVIDTFKDKYNFNEEYISDIIGMQKYTEIYKMGIENIFIVDIKSYDAVHKFLGKTKNVLVYSNDTHNHLNTKDNTTFYGWYDYQNFNKKVRFKLYDEVHKKFKDKGDKTFLSTPLMEYEHILKELNLDEENLLLKKPRLHNTNLFKEINKIIYYHEGFKLKDTNNRLIVEAGIHGVQLDVYLNGYFTDSIYDRFTLMEENRLDELLLTEDDEIIQDFIRCCDVQNTST